MAHAITFKPAPVDYHQELMKRVENAPREHAEALLVLWETLETAHRQGVLELVQGVIGGKDIIAGKLAESAKLPESVAAIRNGIALARLLGAVDPEMLQRLARSMEHAQQTHKSEAQPPSLWQLFRRSTSPSARRGLSFLTHLLTSLGHATQGESKH
jgi:uncharacterized protein YjgD (DUF1641 family)